MANFHELVVVALYIAVGITLPRKIKQPQEPVESSSTKIGSKLARLTKKFMNLRERPKSFAQRVAGRESAASKGLGTLAGGGKTKQVEETA
jgi:hypothetical protein